MEIFLSYARADRKSARELANDLLTLGHHVWLDQNILGGQDWWDEILAHLRSCDVYIYVLSPASLRSQACEAELHYANALARPLLPVKVRETSASVLPSQLAQAQHVDYTAQSRQAGFGLANSLARMPVETPLPEPLPPKPEAPPPRRPLPTWRFILEGVVVAGLAALVARSLAPDIRLDIGTAGESSRFITNLIQVRGVTWAVAGAALGIWLAFRVREAQDYGRCALLGLLVGAIAGALGGAIFGFPVAYGEDQNRFSTTAQLINVGSFAVAGALIGALIEGLSLPPRIAAGLASGGVAAALAAAPFVDGDTNEWVFCLNAAAIAGATLATLVAIDAKRPTSRAPG